MAYLDYLDLSLTEKLLPSPLTLSAVLAICAGTTYAIHYSNTMACQNHLNCLFYSLPGQTIHQSSALLDIQDWEHFNVD